MISARRSSRTEMDSPPASGASRPSVEPGTSQNPWLASPCRRPALWCSVPETHAMTDACASRMDDTSSPSTRAGSPAPLASLLIVRLESWLAITTYRSFEESSCRTSQAAWSESSEPPTPPAGFTESNASTRTGPTSIAAARGPGMRVPIRDCGEPIRRRKRAISRTGDGGVSVSTRTGKGITRAIHSFTAHRPLHKRRYVPISISGQAAEQQAVKASRTPDERQVFATPFRVDLAKTDAMDAAHSPMVLSAQRVASAVLGRDELRLAHCKATAVAASRVARQFDPEMAEALLAAAWLHDIGYAESLAATGFHPLDGALHLARGGWPDVVVRLVAHHSYASVLAPYYGADHHLAVIDPVPGPAAEILTFADLVAGRDGGGSTISARIDEMRARPRSDDPVPAEVREARYRLLERTAMRVLRSTPSGSNRTDHPVELATFR